MPTFILTATHNMNRPQTGLHINRGHHLQLILTWWEYSPVNLFNNSLCQAALTQQFQMNGIKVPKTDYGIYS